MGRLYANAPIVEAICQINFVPNQPWDWTVPGLFYDRVKADFPVKQQQSVLQVQMRAEAETVGQQIKSGVARMQFLREDKRALLQIGPDALNVNQLKPYVHWEQFKAMIARGLDVYREVASPKGIARIGLRYINRIDVPLSVVQIEEYITALPQVPSAVPQTFTSWVLRTEIPFDNSNGLLILQSGQLDQPSDSGLSFMLDLDFVTLKPDSVAMDTALDWVEQAHIDIETTFEACITDKTRHLFEVQQ